MRRLAFRRLMQVERKASREKSVYPDRADREVARLGLIVLIDFDRKDYLFLVHPLPERTDDRNRKEDQT